MAGGMDGGESGVWGSQSVGPAVGASLHPYVDFLPFLTG